MTRIAIVGAGIAGLNAALTLQDAGLSCTLYEASNRLGGRMHSDAITWADGMVSEWCGEFIDADHATIHQLIKRFGLHTVNLAGRKMDRTQSIMYFGNRYYSAEELSRDFQALAPTLQQQLQDAGYPTTYAHFTQKERGSTSLAHMSGLSNMSRVGTLHRWVACWIMPVPVSMVWIPVNRALLIWCTFLALLARELR